MPRSGFQPDGGLEPRSCETCGTEFQPYRKNQITCSRSCRDKLPHSRELARQYDARPGRRARSNELRRAKFRTEGYPKQPNRSPKYSRKQTLTKAGWTIEEYEQRAAELDNKCFLCGASPDPNGIKAASRLHADHDHVTKLRRDLLCGRCNVGVGMFRDDPALLRKAAEYIERHRAAVRRASNG